MAMFIEMMMNQTIAFVHLSVNRSKVKAKLVLDQIAAVTEKLPAASITVSNVMSFVALIG